MQFITTLKKSTYFILPFLGLELYGFNVIISMYFFFFFLCLIDIMLGYSIAWSYGVVSSSVGIKGLLNKVIWIILLAGLIAFLANMAYSIQIDAATQGLSLIIMIVVGVRIGFEGISILENIAIMGDKRESAFFNWMIGMINNLVGIGKVTIEKKIKRYTEDLVDKKESKGPSQPSQE